MHTSAQRIGETKPTLQLTNTRKHLLLFCLLVFSCLYSPVIAQQDSELADLEKQFATIEAELRAVSIETQRIGVQYINAQTGDEAYELAEQYEHKIVEGNAILERWIPVGKRLFELKLQQSPPVGQDLAMFMTKLMIRNYDAGLYGSAYTLSRQLVSINPANKIAEVYGARAGMLTNHFDKSVSDVIQRNGEFFQKEDNVSNTEKILIANMFHLESIFEQELALRTKEAEVDDLPRVEFKTNKGKIVIELFENEAPDTVGNFVSLVEAKHFDGLVFHTVIDQTAAETGKFDENLRPREIGYTIYDEHQKPNSRKIFAGSVVMYRDKPDSSDSRFFIALAALPNLNDKHTVFGRVIQGMDTVYRLNKTFKIEEEQQIEIEDVVPDRVVSASVLRKRDHEYIPRKVDQK